jgi:hypothetical protein
VKGEAGEGQAKVKADGKSRNGWMEECKTKKTRTSLGRRSRATTTSTFSIEMLMPESSEIDELHCGAILELRQVHESIHEEGANALDSNLVVVESLDETRAIERTAPADCLEMLVEGGDKDLHLLGRRGEKLVGREVHNAFGVVAARGKSGLNGSWGGRGSRSGRSGSRWSWSSLRLSLRGDERRDGLDRIREASDNRRNDLDNLVLDSVTGSASTARSWCLCEERGRRLVNCDQAIAFCVGIKLT